MYSFERQSTGPTNGSGGVDELDRLLGGFFRAEMPHPWPAFRRPAKATARPSRWFRARSHIALAATVALLILGSLVFTGTVPLTGTTPTENRSAPNLTADEQENKTTIKEEKAREEELKPDAGPIFDEGKY